MIGKVDKYEILEELFVGRDTFVLKCRGQKIYAMKLLILNQTSKQMVDRFKREMKITATINHANLIRGGDDCGLGKWREKQCFYYLMEYVNGPSLRVLMEDGFEFSEIDVLFIALETLKGLTFLKNKNIVHRDIKPSNILVDHNCEVKIADLGLAKIVEHIDSHTQITMGPTILGTPYYLAPERTFNSDIDFIGDIYSLGATLYEMLTGFPPFRDYLGDSPSLSDYIDILDKYTSPTPVKKINKGIPSNVAKIVDSMLHRDKKRRPPHEKLTSSISKIIQMFPRYPTDELLAKVQQITKTDSDATPKDGDTVPEVKIDVKSAESPEGTTGNVHRENVSQLENFEFLKEAVMVLQRYRNVLYSLRVKEKLSREEKIALFTVLRDYTNSQRDMDIFRFLVALNSAFRQQNQQNTVKTCLTQKIPFDLDFLEKVMSGFIRCVNLGPNHETVKNMVLSHQNKQYTYIHVLNDMLKQNIATKASIRITLMRLYVENELYQIGTVMPYLKIQLDNNVFQSREIIEAISIGRGEHNTNDLVIDDARCSRSHARIYMEDGKLILEDDNSSYGTFVNDERIDKRELNHNDVITIASQKIWYIHSEFSPCQFIVDYRSPNFIDTNWMQVLKAMDVECIVPTEADKITQVFTVLSEKINLLTKMGIIPNTFLNSIRSAISNAVKHGNQNHSQLCVFIRITIVNNKLLVEVRDQGNGFDYIKALEKVKKSLQENSHEGIGINVILKGADMVEWNLVGNQIKLWKNFAAQKNQLSHRDFEESVAVIRTKQNTHLIQREINCQLTQTTNNWPVKFLKQLHAQLW